MASWRGSLNARAAGLSSGRVYWGERPQTTVMPALVITVVSDDRPQTLKSWDLAPARVQFDAYGNTPEEAWTVIEAAITALVPGGIFTGHRFDRADVALGPRDIVEVAGTKTIFRVSMDLIFHHAEIEEVS